MSLDAAAILWDFLRASPDVQRTVLQEGLTGIDV